MDLARLALWLRCPTCGQDLQPAPPLSLRCTHGHAIDANKRGYASLLAPSTRVVGDSAPMLSARARFLARGHFAPVVDALVDGLAAAGATAREDLSAAPRPERRFLDAGCGTGYYLHQLLDRAIASNGLAADLSPAAVSAAVRGRPDVDGVVADTWAGLPLRDGTADVVLDVFAPRNMGEFHRVLAPGGLVGVVTAGPDHLAELRAEGRAVGVQPDKRERILESSAGLFDTASETRVRRELLLSDEDIQLLLGMGPSAHHQAQLSVDDRTALHGGSSSGSRASATTRDAVLPGRPVTLDVMVYVLTRRDASDTAHHVPA